MDGHEPAENANARHDVKPCVAGQGADSRGPWIPANRLGNIAVSVRVAMQDETRAGADEGQITQVDRTDELRRAIEVERQEGAAGPQYPGNLGQRGAITGRCGCRSRS